MKLGGEELLVISFPVRQNEGVLASLTKAERAIVLLAISGLSNKAIAKKRGTKLRTVENQLAAVYAKLQVNSRAELARLCASDG